jgi:hypothetical protein
VNFGANLQDARVVRAKDTAKVAGINTASGILKLCVIEDIECLETKLNQFCFLEFYALGQGHVPVGQTGAMEEATVGITDLSQNLFGEQGGIEIRVSIPWVGVAQDLTRSEIGLVGSAGSREGDIPALSNHNR